MAKPPLPISVVRAVGGGGVVLLVVLLAALAAPANRLAAGGLALLVAGGSLVLGLGRARRAGAAGPGLAPESRPLSELRGSRDLTRRILEGTHDAVVIADPRGIVVDWNGAAERIFGWPRIEALGRPLAETLVPDEELDSHLTDFFSNAGAGATTRRIESMVGRRDGSRLPAELTIEPIRVDERVFLVAFIRDITDRHEAERALRASEERFRRLVETANVVPWEADPRATRLTYVGPQAEGLLGFPQSDWYAEGFWIGRVHVDDRDYALAQLATAAGGEVAGELEYRMMHKHGHAVWVRDIVAADVTEKGPVLRGFRFDVTERRRLEDELVQSRKMEAVGRLAGGIAHDFNNILTAILGYSAMVEQGLADRPELRSDVSEIRRAAAHAADLTQQLLAFARKQVIRPRVLSIDELVQRIEKMVARLIGEDVLVTVVARAEGATARVDPVSLEQALLNLVINARDAMPRGGRLTIGTAVQEVDATRAASERVRAGSYVVITVGDTGVGMDRQTLAHVFEPFYTTKRDGMGSGLGLSTAHGVIAQAGGFIQVESAPNQGSTFRVFLPLAREDAVAPEAPAPRPSVAAGQETILLAEDEPQVRRLAERALLRGGYQVLVAQNGQEAVERSRLFEGTIHLLLTDVLMPVMGGVQAADIIRSERPETRILFVSGYSEDALFRDGVEQAVYFLNKPFTPADLDKKVREVLQT